MAPPSGASAAAAAASSQCSSLSQDSVESSAPSPPMSPLGAKSAPAAKHPNLTAEQKRRMEENRRRALARKREKEELQKQKQRQLQMQRAEENRRRALATKEARRRNRAAMGAVALGAVDAKKPKMESADATSANDADPKLPPIQRTVDGVTLSEEQHQILALARPPPSRESNKQRHLVRITAAAGTGKTTTLIRLALRCIELGHDHLTYVTFSRALADLEDVHQLLCPQTRPVFQRVMSSLGTFAPASEWRVTDMITCRLIRS